MEPRLTIIGELINNSYARARRAWRNSDWNGYQELAKIQTNLGVKYLTLNIDGTAKIQVKREEMLKFLPRLISALQQVVSTPISFDNPDIEFHRIALQHYNREKSPAPILNSLAASRKNLSEMIALVKEFDTNVIIMASEKFNKNGGTNACLNAQDVYETASYFIRRLRKEANRTNAQIIIDPGLAPVGADTYGLINVGLDSMKLIRNDPDLKGCHIMVGLSNFAWGIPKYTQHKLEQAYLTLAMQNGLDFALANPEKTTRPLKNSDPIAAGLQQALQAGRPKPGETQEEAGFNQAEAIMELCENIEDDMDD